MEKELSWKQIFTGYSILFAIFIVMVYLKVHNLSARERGLTEWNIYQGEYAGYNVEINEEKTDGQWLRMVHLTRKGDSLSVISGHTYDRLTSDNWSSVFLCGNENVGLSGGITHGYHGCNSMEFDRHGNGRWEPCFGDKDAQVDFTVVNEKIALARITLNRAVKDVYNEEHRIQTLESFKARNPRS
jgi:hypothetical protein